MEFILFSFISISFYFVAFSISIECRFYCGMLEINADFCYMFFNVSRFKQFRNLTSTRLHILEYILHSSNIFEFSKARRNNVSDMQFLKIKKDIFDPTCIKLDLG